MDVVGTAAAIIQLAGVGLALAQALYTLCDGAKDNKQVKELSFYVRTTSTVFEEVGKIFEEESIAPRRVVSENAIATAKEVAEMCEDVFDTLDKVVKDARKNSFGTLLLVLKSSFLRELQMKLERNKGHMQLLLQIIIYARLKAGTSQSTAPDEADIRQTVHDLIYCGTLDQSRSGPMSDRGNESSSDDGRVDRIEMYQLPSPPSIAELAADGVTATSTALPGAVGTSPSETNARVDNSGQQQNKSPSLAPSGELHTHEDSDISYWIALYTVFCPCVARKKTRRYYHRDQDQTLGERPQPTGTQPQSVSLSRRTDQNDSIDPGHRRKIARWLDLASAQLTGRAHFQFQDSGFNAKERTTFPEVPAESFRIRDYHEALSISRPPQYSPSPRTHTLPSRTGSSDAPHGLESQDISRFQREGITPEIVVTTPDAHRVSSTYTTVGSLPKAHRVPSISDPAFEDQVVQLLQRWTTIYDGVSKDEEACVEQARAS